MVYVYLITLSIACLALGVVWYLLTQIKELSEGTEEMAEKAEIIRQGANTFLITEYKVIIPVVLILAAIFSLFIEETLGLAVILGAIASSLACVVGMKGALLANVRTTNAARETREIGATMQVALRGGAISGFAVQGFALAGLSLMLLFTGGVDLSATGHGILLAVLCNPSLQRIAAYSLGCSTVAMFNRVAGGNYTKAADISADTVAKVRFSKTNIAKKFARYQRSEITKALEKVILTGLDEDSFLNPSVLADQIGDNVNDVAGNCSDLLESFVATISASFLISSFLCTGADSVGNFTNMTMYPMLLASFGLLSSMLGLPFALRKEAAKHPAKALDLFSNLSATFTFLFSIGEAYVCFSGTAVEAGFAFGWMSPVIASFTGIMSGIVIGKITEYFTSADYKPVQQLAEAAKEGAAFVISRGNAIGSRSCLPVVATIGVSLLISDALCGDYGIAVASLGMLSFVAATVSVDAFGPIADNAGGLAETCGLDKEVRDITDQLDSLGNTTAAIGKGYAISSAAFSTISLIKAFLAASAVSTAILFAGTIGLDASNTKVVVGLLLGAVIIEFFIAMLTDNTIDSAAKMADESEAQLMGGVLAGTKKPDHIKCIRMAATEALRKMAAPSLLALVIPIAIGFVFGNDVLGGLLIGATIIAVPRAIYMGNAGGAWDNAKKLIESGKLAGAGKGSEAHMAAVVGDTVGDITKDVLGVSLDIFIKDMSTIANNIASLTSVIHLF